MNLREELTRITTAAEALRAEGGDPVVRKLGEIIGRAAATIESACKTVPAAPSDKSDRGGCAAAQPETSKPIITKEEAVAALSQRRLHPMCGCSPEQVPLPDFTIGKVAMQELIRGARCATVYGAVKLIAAQAGGITSLADLLGVGESAICRAAHAETVKPVIAGMKRQFSFPRIGEEDLENLKADCRAILDEAAVYTVRAALDVLATHEVSAHSVAVMINVSNQSVLNMYNRPDTTPEFNEKFLATFNLKEA